MRMNDVETARFTVAVFQDVAWAQKGLSALKQAGFTDVRMYFGSWNEWSRIDSLPIESGLPVVKSAKKPALALAA